MKMRRDEPMTDERRRELQECIRGMREASNSFYSAAVSQPNHPFIEFTGLMNEYIKVCEESLRAGVDFTETSVHSSGVLTMHAGNAAYLGEKFGCIFSRSLQSKELLETFLEAAELGGES